MFLLSRLPVTLYVGVTIVIWGAVNMSMGAVNSFAGLAATRFFLGFTEGKITGKRVGGKENARVQDRQTDRLTD